MALSEEETNVLDVITRYSFLLECRENGYITEEKYKQIYRSFGLKNKQMVQYYLEGLTEHKKDMVSFLDSVQGEHK
jgi:hypothetical protein